MNNENMLVRLAAIVRRVSGKQTDPDPEESLFDGGYLDSFALVDMVSEIEREFDLKIPDSDLNPRRFDSLASTAEYLNSRGV